MFGDPIAPRIGITTIVQLMRMSPVGLLGALPPPFVHAGITISSFTSASGLRPERMPFREIKPAAGQVSVF